MENQEVMTQQDTVDDLSIISDEDLSEMMQEKEGDLELPSEEVETDEETKEETTYELAEEESVEPVEKEGQQEQETPPDLETIRKQLAEKEEQNQKLSKRVADQEQFISRQSNEVGYLRKYVMSLPQENLSLSNEEVEQYNELMSSEKYYEADRFKQEKLNEKKAARDKLVQENKSQLVQVNKQSIERFIPDINDYIPDIKEVLKSDGAEDSFIDNFVGNLYEQDAANVIYVGRYAKVARENNSLKSKIAELEGKLNGLPNKIKEAVNKTPKITANLNSKPRRSTITVKPSQLGDLTDEQLSAVLRAAQERESGG